MNLIERYLQDSLSPEEMEAFEKHYLGCSNCFEQLQVLHAAEYEIREEGLQHPSRNLARRNRSSFWLRAAAVVLLASLIPLSWYFVQQETNDTSPSSSLELPAELTQVEIMPPFLMPQTRGGEAGPSAQALRSGMHAYQQEDYPRAIEALEEAARLDPDHLPTAFYLGVSYLANQDPERAREPLEKVISSGDPSYVEEAHWYLAKAMLQSGLLEQGLVHLQEVRELDGAYGEEASEHIQILEEIIQRENSKK